MPHVWNVFILLQFCETRDCDCSSSREATEVKRADRGGYPGCGHIRILQPSPQALPGSTEASPAPQMTAQPQLRTLALHRIQLSAPSLILRLMRDSHHTDLSIRPLTSKYTISQTIMFSYPGRHCLKPHTRIHHTTAIIKKQLDKTMAEKSIKGH